MAFNNPGTSARPGRAAVVAAFVAAQTILALHTGASAQIASPSLPAPHFVAPIVKTAAALAGTPAATTAVAAPACNTATPTAHLDHPLLRTMRTLASGDPLTIVAIGSSSTAGAGATSPAASYPNRLGVELRQRFPDRDITVLNRGNNGEETNDMRARFAADVFAAHPQLVIWQVGSNSVLRDRPLDQHAAELHQGIDELKAAGADVVLIDVQYAPGLLAKPATPDMLEQIALTAKEKNVDLFRRFAAMRDWRENQHLSFDAFLSPDGVHMNDWSYACMAKLLAAAIAEAATRPVASAAAHSSH